MSQLTDLINQINQLTGYQVPTSSNYIISQSANPIGSGSVNDIINQLNNLTGYNIPATNVQFVSGANVAGPVIIYTPYAVGGTIPTDGIFPGQIIKAEHVLRIINALNGVNIDDIIISGSLQTSGSNIFNGTLALPFIEDGQYLITSGGLVIGTNAAALSASYADTASYAPAYVLSSITSSMLQPYVLTSQTSSMSVLSSSYALTASYALNTQNIDTSSLVTTSSFNNFTSSVVTTSSFNNFSSSVTTTSSFNNFTSSVVTTSSFNNFTASVVTTLSFNNFTASYNTGSFTGSFIGDGSGLTNLPTQSFDAGSFATTGSNTFIGNQTISGSLQVTEGITGSLQGTASWARNALTASISTTASMAITASIAIVANYADTAGGITNYANATVDQVNIGETSAGTYSYIVRSEELEQSKHNTINIFNYLNFT